MHAAMPHIYKTWIVTPRVATTTRRRHRATHNDVQGVMGKVYTQL